MEPKATRLGKKIAALLKNEGYDDSLSALKIAKILLPTPTQRKSQKKVEEESTTGDMVPADEQLMRFSKAMGGSEAPEFEAEEETPGLQ